MRLGSLAAVRWALVLCSSLGCASELAWAAESTPIPVQAFASLPALRSLQLSPDGQHLLGVMNRQGNSVLVSANADGSDMRSLMESDNSKYQFAWVHWVNNKRLLVGIHYPAIRPGYESTETRLMAMDLDGGNLLNLVPPNRDRTIEIAQIQDRVVDFMPDDGQHILLSLLEDRQAWAPGIYKVNVNTAKREMVFGPRRFVWSWTTDQQHRVRVGVRREGTAVEVLVCDPDGSNWRPLWKFENFDEAAIYPLGFGKDPQQLFVRANRQGHDAVFEARLDKLGADGKPELIVRQADDRWDVGGGLLISQGSGEVLGLRSIESGNAATSFWSEPLKELARGIDQALPDRFNRIYGFSADENRYVVHSSGNAVPDQVFVGDRRKGSLNLLADLYPDLPRPAMAGKKQIKLTARDGLELRGYLTRPKGVGDAAGPLVLLPHGGPISRDDLDFDTWTEFLASRGYSVLQVDFRGSEGYGRAFRNAGLKRWGLEMQDDLTDAVQWAIREKVADPARICVVGGSYGGYAALMGAVKTPDLYRCAVSLAGVTNLLDWSRREATYSDGPSVMDKQIGNYWHDKAQLKSTSPSERAAEIKVPVLLLHGTADRQVPYDQVETMAKALRAAGRSFRLVTMTDADHQLSRQSDRLLFFTELEKFLGQHIGPAAR